jgi:hypothetical protein
MRFFLEYEEIALKAVDVEVVVELVMMRQRARRVGVAARDVRRAA